MTERPRFFDDLAGVAGGAFSAMAGLREEIEGMVRARADETIRRFDLVKREELEAVQEMAAAARTGQEAAEARIAKLEARLAAMDTGPHASATAQPGNNTAGTEQPPIILPASSEGGAPFEPPSVD